MSEWRSASPAGHGPKPESTFIWPHDPAFTRRLPQNPAIVRARPIVHHGSLELAMSTLGKSNRTLGTGAKFEMSYFVSGRSASAGATSIAPASCTAVEATQ